MKKFFIILLSSLTIISLAYIYYYNRWKFLWELEEPRSIYTVRHHIDDTLRVIMIGDSWIEMHRDLKLDTLLERRFKALTYRPVKVVSNGKGHKRSRGIYDLMHKTEGYGTKPLISSGADYCVISAGFNDAGANLGTSQYCYYMSLIIKLLLANGICPVFFEAPDVNIWKLYKERPFMFTIKDYIRSIMTGSGMYHYAEYREALHQMMVDEQLLDSVVYIDVYNWHNRGYQMNDSLFLEDQIHLNLYGYRKLDSCIASAIASDLRKIKR